MLNPPFAAALKAAALIKYKRMLHKIIGLVESQFVSLGAL
jgi:hypothetical protein